MIHISKLDFSGLGHFDHPYRYINICNGKDSETEAPLDSNMNSIKWKNPNLCIDCIHQDANLNYAYMKLSERIKV